MNRYIVVSGLPASGKSTVARAVAEKLALPLLDKDDFLESLFGSVGVGDAEWRRELSHRADNDFQKKAIELKSAVLASCWKHPQSPVDSGTATDWLASLPGLRVEVHCSCSPAVAAERFLTRRRHPGHLDGRWSDAELLTRLSQQALFGPLRFGRLIEVQTEGTLELTALLHRIEQAFELARSQQAERLGT